MANPTSTMPPKTASDGAPRGANHLAGRASGRGRAWAIVIAASLASVVGAALVVASVSVAAGAILIAAVRTVQNHALAAPALAPPPAALNLGPIAADGVLPGKMPLARSASGSAAGSAMGAKHDTIATTKAGTHAAPDALAPIPASADPLAGPRLIAAVHATLIRRDIDGTLVTPEPNPAEAALELISLDEGSRRAINTALNMRGRHLDHAVIINLPFLIVAQSGQAGANKPLVAGVAAIALYRSREFLAVDDLETLIASQLPGAQRSHYRALLHDYWRQYALDAARARADKGEDPAPESLLIAEAKLQLVGEEAARAFERTLRSGDLLHYWFARGLGLSPDQAGPFRTTLAAYSQEHGGDGDSAAKRQLLQDLRQGLNATQQRTLERNLQGFLD
jgi:hypothetical protein